jgi:hypothetical protein
MDDELKGLLREALDLYKRQLELNETSHKQQIAVLEANSKRANGWQSRMPYVVALILIAIIMSVGLPLMDHLIRNH